MKCPKDQSTLIEQPYEADVKVDACPACGGMWLDKGELERIEASVEHDYSEELARLPDLAGPAYEQAMQSKPPELACPKCDTALERRQYGYASQIMVDSCPQCGGVWLDKGEIQALEIFFERSRFEARDIRKAFWASLRLLAS